MNCFASCRRWPEPGPPVAVGGRSEGEADPPCPRRARFLWRRLSQPFTKASRSGLMTSALTVSIPWEKPL